MKLEEQMKQLLIEKDKKTTAKPVDMGIVMKYVRYFLEHLDYLLLQQMNPVARANYFGVIFNKPPTYQEIYSGTRDISELTGINEVFTLTKTKTDNLAGAAGFEPANAGTKNRCLTTWPRPKIDVSFDFDYVHSLYTATIFYRKHPLKHNLTAR